MGITIDEPTAPSSLVKQFLPKAIGIDLGTTHTLAAYVWGDDVRFVRFGATHLLPSRVCLNQDKLYVLTPDKESDLKPASHLVLSSFKRLMGTSISSEAARQYAHPCVEGAQGVAIVCEKTKIAPRDLSAALLEHVFQTVQRDIENQFVKMGFPEAMKEPVREALITTPAYFSECAREQTRLAAEKAGFRVLRLVNEPTSAALAYGIEEKLRGFYGVYDWGGGTFDFSLLLLEEGVFRVKASLGDVSLGGDDLDTAFMAHLKARFPQYDLVENIEETKLLRQTLSQKKSVMWRDVEVTRAMLDDAILPLVQKTCGLVKQALEEAGVENGHLDGLVLAGGVARTPLVQEMLKETVGSPLFMQIDPERVVAHGAALHAHTLGGGARRSHLLLDVTPLSLGIEVMGGLTEKLIPRNTSLPVEVTQTFTTFEAGQTRLVLHILQGERDLAKACQSLGSFELQGIPPLEAGRARIEVTFRLDANGLLTVEAREKETGLVQDVVVKPYMELTPGNVIETLQDGYASEVADLGKRLLLEKRQEAREALSVLKKTEDTLRRFPQNERRRILENADSLRLALEGEDLDHLKDMLLVFEKDILHFLEKTCIEKEKKEGG